MLTCGGYLFASSLLILLNKFLLSSDGFNFPLMLSGSGMLVTFLATSLLVHVPTVVPDRQVRPWHLGALLRARCRSRLPHPLLAPRTVHCRVPAVVPEQQSRLRSV